MLLPLGVHLDKDRLAVNGRLGVSGPQHADREGFLDCSMGRPQNLIWYLFV